LQPFLKEPLRNAALLHPFHLFAITRLIDCADRQPQPERFPLCYLSPTLGTRRADIVRAQIRMIARRLVRRRGLDLVLALQVKKSIYDYVVYESEVEREFARKLDQREDIRLFVKLPGWFEVGTPLGTYNPDWAIVKHHDETVYLVRETKGTKDFLKLRTAEADKVRCGQRHFQALGVPFAVATTADDV
jgi:restriction endonuclease